MSTMLTQSRRRSSDHFQPEDMEPQEQRRLRGLLDAVQSSTTPIVLFIDEVHTLVGAGGQACLLYTSPSPRD